MKRGSEGLKELIKQRDRTIPRELDKEANAAPLDFKNIELHDVIDAPAIQEMMNDYHALTGIGIGILDLKGEVLIGTGWQDICIKFHRAQPESCKFCRESDTSLSSGVSPGTFKAYRCKNNMWDMVTPIMLADPMLLAVKPPAPSLSRSTRPEPLATTRSGLRSLLKSPETMEQQKLTNGMSGCTTKDTFCPVAT